MSGYYSAEYTLARIAKAIAACTGAKRRAHDAAVALAASAEALAEEVAAARVSVPELHASYGALAAKLEGLRTDAGRLGEAIALVGVPESAAQTTDAEVAQAASQIERLAAETAPLERLVAETNAEFVSTSIADAALADARRVLFAIDTTLRSHAESFDRWAAEVGTALRGQVEATLQELRQLALAEGAAHDLTAGAKELGERVAAMAATTDQEVARIEALQAAHERRTYTLKGLRHVCSRLGFVEIDGPRYESGRPESAVVFAVDTRSKGTISFKLGLDAQIETDSKMNPKYCASEFGKLSDELVSAYGIQSQFTHTGPSAVPKRKTFDAEDLPEGSPAAHSQEWHNQG